VLYRPSEKKLKNAGAKSYMGKPVLIAATDSRDAFTGFTGSTNMRQGVTPTGVYIENKPVSPVDGGLGRSATAPAALPSMCF